MDTFVQQMGRCGRDGQFSHELMLHIATPVSYDHIWQFVMTSSGVKWISLLTTISVITSSVKPWIKDNTECRRFTLCNSYLINTFEITPIHNCCDVCEKNCECSDAKTYQSNHNYFKIA
jgi:superfamily II DNA helicase RecQ